jgi:hypothetical protein
MVNDQVVDEAQDMLWPVSLNEIGLVRDRCTKLLVELCRARAGDGDTANLLNAFSPYIIVDVTSVFQAVALALRGSRELRKKVGAMPGRLWPAAIAGCTPLPPDILQTLRAGWASPGLLRDVAHTARSWLRRDVPRYQMPVLTDFADDIVCFTRAGLMLDHLRKVDQKSVYMDPHVWFPPLTGTEPLQAAPDWLAPAIDSMVRQAFAAAGMALPHWLEGYFPQWIGAAVAACQYRLDSLRKRSSLLPKQLWTGSAGKAWARLLRMAVMEAGGTVTGHDHGGGSGHCMEPYKALRDWEFCSEFVFYSEKQKDSFVSSFRADFYVPQALPKMSVCKSTESASVTRRSERQARIRRVLYASGLSDGEHLHLAPLMTTDVMIDWQARLISALCDGGWDVHWKPHPDAVRPSEQMIGHAGFKTLQGKFENALEAVDAILIDTCRTSAFPLAIASGLPIVLVNFPMYELRDYARSLLELRGVVVDGWFDGGNRAQIDFAHLHDAIRRSNDLDSPAFQNEFH